MIECKCGSPSCKTQVWFEANKMWVKFTNIESNLDVQFDANTCVEMIRGLSKMLKSMPDLEQEEPE